MKAAVFPGQGSQKPGMGLALVAEHAVAAAVFDEVTSATGDDLRAICGDPDAERLRDTRRAQIALFTTSVAAWSVMGEADPAFGVAGGHSVGEYAALVAAGWLELADGARLVKRRGEVMAAAGDRRPGTMAAVLGLELGAIEAALESVPGVVTPANDNAPGQIVISGEREAVAAASERLTEAGARRVIALNVSGAFHSPLMEEAAAEFAEALREVTFREGRIQVISNVTAQPVENADQLPDLLVRQLREPVRWTESVRTMRAMGADTFVEFGGGEVLGGLIRRIDKEASTEAYG
jgi:[acyl-carrier-protein] S-malonyltransferase